MPEAQSVLLCDKADFRAIMDFLFFSISVCTDSRLNELLTKTFFDLVRHVVTFSLFKRSVADPGCLLRIKNLNFFHPDPIFFHPGSASKNFSILIQKIVSKIWEI
jgi:hypothetical protein